MRAFLLVIAIVIVSALYGLSAGHEGDAAPVVAQPAAPVVVRTPHTGVRVRYAEAKLPRLILPDGRQKVIRSVLNITGPMKYGSFVWNEDGVPDGTVWVRVDLKTQMLSVFRGGHEIGSAVILYGTDGTPTPTGQFAILEKRQDYRSRNYDAPMPYALRLTGDWVAIHGSDVREGWGTHGCIGVPLDFARKLFAAAGKGDAVVILPAHRA